jgi:hypothetical protein
MVVGSAVAVLVGLTPLPANRAARHGRLVASESLCLVLEQEIAAASGKTRGGGGHSRTHTTHEPSQPLVGRTPHSWGTPLVGGLRWRNRRWLGICLVLASRALPDLANLLDQSSRPDCGHWLFHRANGDLPYVERLVGSIRRECLDHVIVWNRRPCTVSCKVILRIITVYVRT